ncbi:MAG: type II secretion system protein GspF [bacterium]|nr:type II secretion system protein GspF [bacterium]
MQYRYKAKKLSGEVIEGVLEADNRKLVINQLQKMQVFPLTVEELRGGKGLNKEISLAAIWGVSAKDVTTFSRQMSDLLRSGLPLVRSLMVIRQQTANPKLVEIIKTIESDVSGGMTFSDSLGKHPRTFSSLYSSMVAAGEAGGMLDQVMERLAQFLENEQETRSRIISAMTYPAFMVFVCISVIIVLFLVVVPNFKQMFDDMDVDLPMSTQVLLGFSGFVSTYWWVAPLVIVPLVLAFRSFIKTKEGRLLWDGLKLNVPLIGELIRKREIAKFGRTLGTLLQNGVAILKALDITERVISNGVLKQEIEVFKDKIKEGEKLSTRMGNCGLFPPVAVNMVAVGEETGSMEVTLQRVADAFEGETDRVIKTITTVIEPMMIVVMALIVGFIVFAMIMPIFAISQNI